MNTDNVTSAASAASATLIDAGSPPTTNMGQLSTPVGECTMSFTKVNKTRVTESGESMELAEGDALDLFLDTQLKPLPTPGKHGYYTGPMIPVPTVLHLFNFNLLQVIL